jgi:hypothetical protein
VPSATPDATSTEAPPPSSTPEVTPAPEPTALGSPSAGTADACTGSADNRSFYSVFAAGVPYDVYCAVLPAGWYLATGGYRLGGSGKLQAAYHGPGGMLLSLLEGAFCADTPDACSPSDSVIGPAAFGDREGTLGSLSGAFVLYVDPGLTPAWQATGSGMTEGDFRSFCAAFAKVGA